ncbi:MAG: 16S rRNA (cytosine(1402)-N(4))-methyltransferase RsmH [Alphaproteobacteria bacterium]|nr:16S rRNA (cytosine(1402)-N(4))-methyltransferase RsmH [Alphaproteobacteria bacterium]
MISAPHRFFGFSEDHSKSHVPVMLREAIALLSPRDGGVYLDGTFGAGGYTRSLLNSSSCCVIAIDRDPEAIEGGMALTEAFPDRLFLIKGCYSDMIDHAAVHGFGKVDGIVLDIGVSSMQLDDARRGFSFLRDGPLDMRMGCSGPGAADLVNHASEQDLATIIFILGEERRSRAIARAVVVARSKSRITGTLELADIVARAVGGGSRNRKHPATKTFQALRAYVNCELQELSKGLLAAEILLAEGGVLVLLTFHSLEDRIVKQFFALSSGKVSGGSRHKPELKTQRPVTFMDVLRPVMPSEEEITSNPRSRSARLRTCTRTAVEPATGLSLPGQDLFQLLPFSVYEEE